MIKLFNSTDTLFSSNGDKVIIPIKAKIHKEDTGATVYYVGTETLPITDTTLIGQLDAILNVMSYYKQTNITVESEGLNPILKFNYKKSGRAKDEEQDRKIEELEERIAQLEQG